MTTVHWRACLCRSACSVSYNPTVHQYLSEARPPLLVLCCMHPRPIARKCRVFLWSVSPHICRCGGIGQLPRLMALTLSGWKPIHHTGKKKKMVREEREGGLRGEAGGGEKNNGSSVLHSLKRLFITMVPLSGSLPVYPWGESNPCQTHLWAWTWRNGPSWSHTDGTAGDRRHMDVSCPALSRTSAMSRHSLELRSVLRWRSTHSTKQIWVFWWRCTSSYLTALERRRQTICFKLTL